MAYPRLLKGMPPSFSVAPLVTSLLVALSQNALADSPVFELNTIEVTGQAQQTGRIDVTRRQLEVSPNPTGTVTDALRDRSSIQFSSNSRAATNQADIASPLISIAGSTPTQSTYLINGLNNDNPFNPKGYGESVVTFGLEPVGNPEALMVNDDLLTNIQVYDADVPVAFGGFSGGVVDARLRRPQKAFHGSVGVRYTSDKFTRMHYVPGSPEAAGTPSDHPFAHRFSRTSTFATLEGPLGSTGLLGLVSLSRHQSVYDTQSNLKGGNHKNRRYNDNLMVRLATDTQAGWDLTGTLIYAPYEGHYFASDNLNGEWTNKGGGLTAQVEFLGELPYGEVDISGELKRHTLSRDAGGLNRAYTWLNVPGGYMNWTDKAQGKEGLHGDLTYEDKGVSIKPELRLSPFGSGLIHNITVGLEGQYDKITGEDQGYTSFAKPDSQNAASITGDKTDGIIAGEQYALQKYEWHPQTLDHNYWRAAFYLEDRMEWGRFTVRPGLRLEHDSIMKATTLSPRLFTKVDLFNDQRFTMTGGVARYADGPAMSEALGFDMSMTSYKRQLNGNQLGPWTKSHSMEPEYADVWSKLKVPYVNEVTLGGEWASETIGTTSLKWQRRAYRRQIATEYNRDGLIVYNNKGTSDYDGVTLTWKKGLEHPTWGAHDVTLGVTYAKVTGNNPNGFSVGSDMVSEGKIMLDGKLVDVSALPASNFNIPWTVTLRHDARLFNERLQTSLVARWQSASSRLVRVYPAGAQFKTYETVHRNHWFNADLNLRAVLVKKGDRTLTATVDITNLFDNHNLINESQSASATGHMSVGRQFMVGLEAKF